MPKPKPNFDDFKYLFLDMKYDIDVSHFNVNTKITITCPSGHCYITSITKIKNLNHDYKNCPHCKKEKEYSEMGVPYKTFKDYADKYNFEIVNFKNNYNRWTDCLILKCKICSTQIEKKSLAYLEKTQSPIICEQCEIDKLGLLNKEDFKNEIESYKNKAIETNPKETVIENEIITKYNCEITENVKEKLNKQNRWIIKEYNGTRNKGIFICNKCGYEKQEKPYNLIHKEKNTGCIACRDNKLKNNFKDIILELCHANNILPINILGFAKDIHSFKCNGCGFLFDKCCRLVHDKEFTLHCPECFANNRRGAQTEFSNYISSIFFDEIIPNDRKTINPYELDVYIPSKKIAFEYCGIVWHCTKFSKDSNKHYKKWKLCKDFGIRLITVFEDEWQYKRKICESRIKNCLNLITNKIYAKNCTIKTIDNLIALKFCEDNHIQGRGQSHIAYGLFHDNILVSVMTFSKPSAAKNGSGYDYELNRFCSLIDHIVVGGASKLICHFKKEHKGTKLITFCDVRWGSGDVYDKLGFRPVKHTSINYFYVGKYTDWKRKHRFSFTKNNLIEKYKETDPTLTEEQIALKNGLYRIYDCGHFKYEMDIQ